jgi:hypothetical protein
MKRRARLILIAATAALAATAIAIGADDHDAIGDASPSARAFERSRANTERPGLPTKDAADNDPGKRLMGRALEDEGALVASRVPFPEGASPPDWARGWEGAISPEGVVRVTELRAACAWYARLRADPSDAIARQIVQDIPEWPTFKQPGVPYAEPAQTVATEARSQPPSRSLETPEVRGVCGLN